MIAVEKGRLLRSALFLALAGSCTVGTPLGGGNRPELCARICECAGDATERCQDVCAGDLEEEAAEVSDDCVACARWTD